MCDCVGWGCGGGCGRAGGSVGVESYAGTGCGGSGAESFADGCFLHEGEGCAFYEGAVVRGEESCFSGRALCGLSSSVGLEGRRTGRVDRGERKASADCGRLDCCRTLCNEVEAPADCERAGSTGRS